MRIYYSLYQALDYLRTQIEMYEKMMEEEKSHWERKRTEHSIEWLFERGINLIQYTEPGEVDKELIDCYLGRIKGERPDIAAFRKKLEKRQNESWWKRI